MRFLAAILYGMQTAFFGTVDFFTARLRPTRAEMSTVQLIEAEGVRLDALLSKIYVWRTDRGELLAPPVPAPARLPEPHDGATHEWADLVSAPEMREGRDLPAELKRVLLTPTDEHAIVYVPLERRTRKPRKSRPAAPVRTQVEDELGTWDPDAVDWSEPAIYYETSRDLFAEQVLTVPEADRAGMYEALLKASCAARLEP